MKFVAMIKAASCNACIDDMIAVHKSESFKRDQVQTDHQIKR